MNAYEQLLAEGFILSEEKKGYFVAKVYEDEECVVIGAGMEYLFGRLYKIFPEDALYAMENPGYQRIRHIYEDYSLQWKCIAIDHEGIKIGDLKDSKAKIIHTSPEHRFPKNLWRNIKKSQVFTPTLSVA